MHIRQIRISIYIDGPNLFYCGDSERCRLDYIDKFKRFVIQNRKLVDLNFYNSIGTNPGAYRFHKILKSAGYNLKLFKLGRDYTGKPEEKRVDTQLVADSIYDAFINKYDIAAICSGDEDFVPAVEYILKMGKQVEVMAFGTGFSWNMRETKHLGAKIIVLSNYTKQICR